MVAQRLNELHKREANSVNARRKELARSLLAEKSGVADPRGLAIRLTLGGFFQRRFWPVRAILVIKFIMDQMERP